MDKTGSGAVAYELMFSTTAYDEINDIYLLDDYAVAVIDNSALKAIYYADGYLGAEVPVNYGINLLPPYQD